MDRSDWTLLAAYLLAAAVGSATQCLLFNDGAVFLTAGWLGDAWALYFGQFAGRAVAMMLSFGPAQLVRRLFGASATDFILASHLLYFAVPLAMWLVLRAVEPYRIFSRIYLASVLPMIFFPSELAVGSGLWMIWLALVNDASRSTRQIVVWTLTAGAALAFTHPVVALMSLFFAGMSALLAWRGRTVPLRNVVAAVAMGLLLLAAYAGTSRWLPPTNRTVLLALSVNRFDYVNPRWILSTLGLFPMLAALWILLLGPGLPNLQSRWRLSPAVILIIALAGVWFAAAGSGLLTWLYARYTAPYILAVALALALAAPTVWLVDARRPLALYAAVVSVAFISYGIDLALFGRFVDRYLAPGEVNVEASLPMNWPAAYDGPPGARVYFKWAAGDDYGRDVLVPGLDWYRVTLAFYSFFRSNRQTILFHPLGRAGDWLPFECRAVEQARDRPHDDHDRMLLDFLAHSYCVR